MKQPFKAVAGLLLGAGLLLHEAYAQETAIAPVPLPPIATLPAAPDGAQASYDQNAVELLTYMVELSRLMGGGTTQLLTSAHVAEKLLIGIQDAAQMQLAAISGPKPFPQSNSEADVAARKAGQGPWEMANAALNGETVGSDGIQAALIKIRKLYRLDDAFALRNDKLLSNVMVAHSAAQGAVAASAAEDSYRRANDSMGRINDYVTALSTSSDLKTSVDINTRVMIEVAQQLNETLRTQAAIASVAGTYLMSVGAEAAEPDTVKNLFGDFNR
ncbi:type IV secretion system protein [Mesorhizobium sp. WSM3626]|uniref:type IV secretion system protein n=1 Tax=Mesorhizobium sp. WSM3626 TaxID=1040987 RepID=UPI00048538A5|nr:type IV secretion system protein [Mesorhizobium sp. WSM3626]